MKLYVSVTFKKCGNVGFRPVITYNGLAGSDKDFFVLTPLQAFEGTNTMINLDNCVTSIDAKQRTNEIFNLAS